MTRTDRKYATLVVCLHPRRALTALVAGVVFLGVVPAHAGPTPAQQCQAGKNKTAGKYAACRENAEAKLAASGDTTKYGAAITKCGDKFTTAWQKLEDKAVAAGSACPSVGDATGIDGRIAATTDTVAARLSGDPYCGDGVIGGGEDCDGGNLGGATCTSLGYSGAGTLACTPGCAYDTIACTCAPSQTFPATGQTTCWDSSGSVIACASTGHDGDIQAGATLAYTDNGDGTITDTNTGLMWEKHSQDGGIHDRGTTYTWDDAVTVKITALNSGSFAGYTDWRLPNVKELLSIQSYETYPALSPAFHNGCMAGCTVLTCNCQPGVNWSSTTAALDRANAMVVLPAQGLVSTLAKSFSTTVRAVRGGL